MIETDNNTRYTVQGRKVAEHWSRLAVTYEGALKTLKSKGINAEDVTVEDLHLLDMLHMGGLAATDEIAALSERSERRLHRQSWRQRSRKLITTAENMRKVSNCSKKPRRPGLPQCCVHGPSHNRGWG